MSDIISIIMPAYNAEKYIEEAILSVIAQTYEYWELIIIDDKSTDNTKSIIHKYSIIDNRIKAIYLDNNMGCAIARNKGIEKAQGDYIAFLDADDVWLPEKLEKQIMYMKDNSLLLTYSSYFTIRKNGRIINLRRCKKSIKYYDMLKTDHIGNLTGIYNCKKIGKIYFKNINHEDYVYWLEIMKRIKKTKGITIPLAKYRIIRGSLSSNKLKTATWQYNIYRNYLKFNIFKTFFYMFNYFIYGILKRI